MEDYAEYTDLFYRLDTESNNKILEEENKDLKDTFKFRTWKITKEKHYEVVRQIDLDFWGRQGYNLDDFDFVNVYISKYDTPAALGLEDTAQVFIPGYIIGVDLRRGVCILYHVGMGNTLGPCRLYKLESLKDETSKTREKFMKELGELKLEEYDYINTDDFKALLESLPKKHI